MEYTAVVTREGRRALATFVDAPGCQTFAESEAELYVRGKEALEGWLEAHLVDGEAPPRPGAKRARPPKGGRLLRVRVPGALAARLAIRWARQNAGVSQGELAKRVGVSRQAIAQLEAPDANVTIGTLDKVARALGLELEISLEEPAA